MAKPKKNLHSKLTKVFLVQVALISVVALAGVFAAREMIESVLMQRALQGEAEYFWQQREADPQIAMPNTLNLRGFLAPNNDVSAVPVALQALHPGLQRAEFEGSTPLIYVEDKQGDRLYLIFDEQSVSLLTLLFGVLPLTAVLIVLYIFAWFAHRQSYKAISPIVRLAKVVEEAKWQEGKWLELNLDELRTISDLEASTLIQALDHFTERLTDFIERERNFTRDASHELRTPIAVLRSAMEVLERKYGEFGDASITRMYRTLYDMEALIETLLLLAREGHESLPAEQVVVNDLVVGELELLQPVYKDKPITTNVEELAVLELFAPPQVVRILVNNLLRNAFVYTPQGRITVSLEPGSIAVEDSGVGMDKEQLKQVGTPFYRGCNDDKSSGYGLGMAIVKRLCNRYGWELELTSEVGKGTRVRVRFGN